MGVVPIQKTYVVGGLFQIGMSEYDQAFVYMPLSQAQLFFSRGPGIDYIEVKLEQPDLAPALKPALAEAAGRGAGGHRLDREEPGLLRRPHSRAQRDVPDPGPAGADRLGSTSSRRW